MINLCHPNLPNLCSKHPKIELDLFEEELDMEMIFQSKEAGISSANRRIRDGRRFKAYR